MGCRIGERTIVTEPMQCFDWNAVNFGNDCYVDGFLQFHTFENMTLKVKKTSIEDGCTVNTGATIMGGAVIEPGSTLLPLSMVLKEMNLSPAAYEGSPAEPVSDSDSSCTHAAAAARGDDGHRRRSEHTSYSRQHRLAQDRGDHPGPCRPRRLFLYRGRTIGGAFLDDWPPRCSSSSSATHTLAVSRSSG